MNVQDSQSCNSKYAANTGVPLDTSDRGNDAIFLISCFQKVGDSQNSNSQPKTRFRKNGATLPRGPRFTTFDPPQFRHWSTMVPLYRESNPSNSWASRNSSPRIGWTGSSGIALAERCTEPVPKLKCGVSDRTRSLDSNAG